MKKERKKIIIDTDIGDDVDDAAALMMAFNSPELEVIGITTVFQNTGKRAEMVLDLCHQYGKEEIPVYAGYGIPLIERPLYEESPLQYEILSNHYSFEQNISAVDFMIQTLMKNPETIIVEMGAMTNLAMAFYQAPEVMKNAQIIAMGGVFTQNAVEWNIGCDPEAARIVMDYAKDLKMFGLEITKYCRLSEETLSRFAQEKNDRIAYFYEGVELFREKTGYPVTLHDALLIAYLIDDSIVKMKRSDYTVELFGKMTRGSIVRKENAYELHPKTTKNFYYVEEMDVRKFSNLITERIC